MTENFYKFVSLVKHDLDNEVKHTKRTIEKLASTYGITDQNTAKELTELAIVLKARELAHQDNKSIRDKFFDIVDLYTHQVNLSHRTSRSILLQQYSTPAPIGYMMGVYCGVDSYKYKYGQATAYEPSAGNGLLTIAGFTEGFKVNEIDETRRNNLIDQNFLRVTGNDASIPTFKNEKEFDAVITNPPFGQLGEPVKCGGFLLDELDHIMAFNALNTMKDDGRAAIIVGGHITYDTLTGRIKQQGEKGGNRNFYNFLYRNYNVDDILYINGDLYSRQGTSFDVRLILINGRKPKPEGFAPRQTKEMNQVINTWNEFYDAVIRYIPNNIDETMPVNKEIDKAQSAIDKYTKITLDAFINDDIKYRKERGNELSPDDFSRMKEQTELSIRHGFEKVYEAIQQKDYEALKSKLWLHNKFWRRFFEEITGLKIGNTLKQTYAVLEEFTGYKPEPKAPVIKISKEEALRRAVSAKEEKILNQKASYEGVIRTRKEHVEFTLNNGGHVEIAQVPSVTTSRTRYNRMTWQQQEEFNRKEKIKKPEYRLFTSKSSFYTISKAEYNYAIAYQQTKETSNINLLAMEFEALDIELQLLNI